MQKIIEFLENNNIEYEYKTFGNNTYFKDGFTCAGVSVIFDYDIAKDRPDLQKKEDAFLKFLKQNKRIMIYAGGKSHCAGRTNKSRSGSILV